MIVTVTSTGTRITVSGGGVQGPPGPAAPKGVALDWPTNNENVTMFYTPYAITLADMHVVLRGTGTVDFAVRFAPGRDDVGTTIASATCDDADTGQDVAMDEPEVPAGSYVWLETTAVTGEVREFHLNVWF